MYALNGRSSTRPPPISCGITIFFAWLKRGSRARLFKANVDYDKSDEIAFHFIWVNGCEPNMALQKFTIKNNLYYPCAVR